MSSVFSSVTNFSLGSSTFYLLYTIYYFYCFNVANLAYKDSTDVAGVQSACMDGVFRELHNTFAKNY